MSSSTSRPPPSLSKAASRAPPPLPPHVPDDDDVDRELGTVVADVVDALGETVRARLELVEERALSRARVAGLQGLGALAVALFVLAAWVCGAIALGLVLREPLGGAGALAILAAIHLVIAGLVAGAVAWLGRGRSS